MNNIQDNQDQSSAAPLPANAAPKQPKKPRPSNKGPRSSGASGYTSIMRSISQKIHLYKEPETTYYLVNFLSIVALCYNFEENMRNVHLPREFTRPEGVCIFAGSLAWVLLLRFFSIAQQFRTATGVGIHYAPSNADMVLPSFLVSLAESFGEFVDRENGVRLIPYVSRGLLSTVLAFARRCFTVTYADAPRQHLFDPDFHVNWLTNCYGRTIAGSTIMKTAAMEMNLPTPHDWRDFFHLAIAKRILAEDLMPTEDFLAAGPARQVDLNQANYSVNDVRVLLGQQTVHTARHVAQRYFLWTRDVTNVQQADVDRWLRGQVEAAAVFSHFNQDQIRILNSVRDDYVSNDEALQAYPDFGAADCEPNVPENALRQFVAAQAWMKGKMTCRSLNGGFAGTSAPLLCTILEGSSARVEGTVKFTPEEAVQGLLFNSDFCRLLTAEKEIMNFNHRLQLNLPHKMISIPHTPDYIFAQSIVESLK